MPTAIPISTPFKDAHSAFELFCSIRKAEGASFHTIDSYKTIIKPFLREFPEFLKDPRLSILSYISEPKNEWSRFTRIKVLKVFCKFLVVEGILDSDPTRGIKVPMPDKKIDIPTLDQAREFIKALNTDSFTDRRLRAMLIVAIDCGLRRGELCGLKQSDLDTDILALTVSAEYSKARKSRIVPVSPQVYRELKTFISLIPIEWRTPWLFPSNTGGKLQPANMGRQMRRVADKVEIDLKIHGLRHLCANLFLKQTGNISLTAQLLGHSNIRTTSRFYDHLNFEDLQEAHSKVNLASSIVGNKKMRKINV